MKSLLAKNGAEKTDEDEVEKEKKTNSGIEQSTMQEEVVLRCRLYDVRSPSLSSSLS